MQFNGFYMKPPSKENENEVIEENTHFPVIAIVGACVSILFPIAGIICGIISLTNSVQQEGIGRRSKISNIVFSALLLILSLVRQTLAVLNGGGAEVSSSSSSEEELLHILLPLLF
ncbi:unknown [Coprobacillus sp. CAG:826]|jgi:hypothetical protein|nr:hypothetical protein [Coprobacillus sp.]CDD91284.1 unknown [Coprobacillus sp. CAG:826]